MIEIDLALEDPRWQAELPEIETLIAKASAAAFDGAKHMSDGLLSILLADDAQLAELNQNFRGKAGPTNILSFPPAEMPLEPDTPPLLGDLALAFETMQREATNAAIPLSHHLQHLIVHGALHLLGYDHETDPDAEKMEALETAILSRIGIPDPYAG